MNGADDGCWSEEKLVVGSPDTSKPSDTVILPTCFVSCMTETEVAGTDWAGGGWLAVLVSNQTLSGCCFRSELQNILDHHSPDRALIDVPIGLPEEDPTKRAQLDSKARELDEYYDIKQRQTRHLEDDES